MRILILILVTFFLTSFNLPDNYGKYEYKNSLLSESIELLENQTFIYNRGEEFFNYTIKGNYNIVGDSLILDSSPQKDKIIVRERFVKKFETKIFNVTNKRGENITYHLYVTLNDGSKEVHKDNFGELKFKSKPIKSFHVFSTMGIKSPEYIVTGTNTNGFDIQLETQRIFENEKWFIDKINHKIKPRSVNGEFKFDYFLEKK